VHELRQCPNRSAARLTFVHYREAFVTSQVVDRRKLLDFPREVPALRLQFRDRPQEGAGGGAAE
jgi:hypothetical protein